MDILLAIHSFVRWIIILVAVIVIIKFAVGWAGNSLFKAMDRGLASAFSGLMDLQVTLGLIYLIWNGIVVTGFPTYRILHGVTMIIAADCLPRLSPPAACPASMPASSRKAR